MSKDPALADLQDRIGWRFRDTGLLTRALTHSSFGDGAGVRKDNERLEFLGDRVVNLLTAETLYKSFSDMEEGGLAARLNALVRRETCARVARAAGLDALLRLSKAEDRNGGREKDSILGDVCEALIGALYLDGGIEAARGFMDIYWETELPKVEDKPSEPKTALQEWALAHGHDVPRYQIVGRTGPDHAPVFKVEVSLEGVKPEHGKGGSKQEAERNAAQALFVRETVRD